jgi:CHAT domain-containing protein
MDAIKELQRNISIALTKRAEIELRLQQYTHADDDLKEAIRISDDDENSAVDVQRAIKATIEEVRGRALLHVNSARAIASFTNAIALTGKDTQDTLRASLFAQRAEAYRSVGRRAEAEADLQAALKELRVEERLILKNRARGEAEEAWSLYFARFQDAYRLLIRQLIDEGKKEEAFTYAEKARAVEPLNLVLQTKAVPKAFLDLAPHGEPLALPDIQRLLPAGTFLLEYCVLNDRTYAWIVAHDGIEMVRLEPGRKEIADRSEALRRAVRGGNHNNEFGTALYALYERLFAAPLTAVRRMHHGSGPPRLVVVPDGAMHAIPLAALRNPDTRSYLVEDATPSAAGSATLYIFSLLRDRALPMTREPSALLVGDPAFDPGTDLARRLVRLPASVREVESIAAVYAPRAEVLLDKEATVPRFLEDAQRKDVIHLAGHAIANAQAPHRSLLLLAPSTGDSGLLEADVLVRRLRLKQTRLVVLSACSSAGGLPVGPEGLAPLVRPLIGAGVPAVVGSLWDINDATTAELLVSFHRHYREGSDAAVALQLAQLELLHRKNAGLASVLAWAPFQVIGYASSPFALPLGRAH